MDERMGEYVDGMMDERRCVGGWMDRWMAKWTKNKTTF